jgi:hypothetical protein
MKYDWSRNIPFLERDGKYWGLPLDNRNAISEQSFTEYWAINSVFMDILLVV